MAAIRLWMAETGYSEFSYAGDSVSDLPIWAEAETVLAVSPNASLEHRISKLGKDIVVLDRNPVFTASVVKALRPL